MESDSGVYSNFKSERGEIHANGSEIQTAGFCEKCFANESFCDVFLRSWKITSVSQNDFLACKIFTKKIIKLVGIASNGNQNFKVF